jgi:hypothetical protein
MAKTSLSAISTFALDMALEAERAGIPIDQMAKPGHCSGWLVALAESLRLAVAEMRANLHADADELGVSTDELDTVFNDMLGEMLGPRGMVH